MIRQGGEKAIAEGATRSRAVVAFDFDGTLTTHDSFTAFLRWRVSPTRYLLGLARMLPDLLAYVATRDRGALKTAAAAVFLKGMRREELAQAAQRFAAERFNRMIRPDALACWRAHGEHGDERVIVTASPEDVVRPFAERLGAERLIGTRLAYDAADRVTGAFDGANCRGVEKVRRLESVYGPGLRLAAAYGDTAGDAEMLAVSERPGFRVFTARPGPAKIGQSRKAGFPD